jgi:hypothetical protein
LHLATILVAFVLLDIAVALYFRQKQGGADNQYIGLAWALAMLGGLAWRAAMCRMGAAFGSAAILALAFLLAAHVRPVSDAAARRGYPLPTLLPDMHWPEVPAPVRALAGTRRVYDQYRGDLNAATRGEVWSGVFNFVDLLAAGRQPRFLVQAFLDRRFDAVTRFETAYDIYASGYGRFEENYLWKLNRVIEERYAPDPTLPAGYLGRRSGPERATWMRLCFGPFPLAGARLEIRAGGGFWCRPGDGSVLELRETPADRSEVRTVGTVALPRGGLAVEFPSCAGGAALIVDGGGADADLALVARTGPKGCTVGAALRVETGPAAAVDVSIAPARGAVVGIRLRAGDVSTAQLAPDATGRQAVVLTLPSRARPRSVSFVASRGSGARFDLAGLRLG